ncbi:MAG: TonB-dependent receptor plug domain-containing protein [Arenimonas sp.]|uniref:TonB-dependent receptor plug domain-containing protein n=1 Tax=Arenimonas sp. TaxID=1872635 RepID=UPI003C0C1A5C
MINRKKLSAAVHSALILGTGAMLAPAVQAQAQEEAKTIDTVQVTGSRIKRVDAETASPVFQLEREAIDKTGALTIGDFLQDIPAVAGAATNPAVNNGGGTGAATVSLRGLGDERTLILVNGRRIVTRDVNAIPMSMVQTVEVLKDGASAIYGSDAVGGVVNFILKSNFDGLEARVDYGLSSRHDGQRQGASVTWGASGDRGNIIVSANYNKQDEVRASARAYSYYALSLGSTSSAGVVQGGSSRAITGRYFVSGYPCSSVTLNPVNPGTSTGDFRCWNFGRDAFNYQAVGNLQLTPQERSGLFVTANFDITDNVTAYVDAFANKTRSASQIAPLPFDGLSDGISLSQYNQYNVWGQDVFDIRLRLSRLGNRRYEYVTDVSQFNAGLKGDIGETSWSWDFNVGYGKINQENDNQGYIDYVALAKGLGPSQGGVCYTDGTFTTPIPGCTPIDFVGNFDPNTAAGQAQLAALEAISLDVIHKSVETQKSFQANFSGDLFELGSGTVQAAVGVEYRKNFLDFNPFDAAIIDPSAGYTCGISSELCTAPTKGELTVKEIYGEVLIPVTETFNASIGTRWSDYSAFGSSINSKLGLEWRPSEQLLLRGTYAEVFRAPTITDLYGGQFASSDTFADPCNGISQVGGGLSTNPACTNVVADGSFGQTDTQLNAIKGGNADLRPEEGEVITVGFVYEPSWFDGFSSTVDFWNAKLDGAINPIGSQNILNICFNSTAANPSPLCSLFSRRPNGEMEIIFDRKANVGKYDTSGVDIGFKYRKDTSFGKFRASLDATYLDKFDVDVIYNGVVLQQQENAGTFLSSANGGLGNYSQWRALGNLGWSKDIFDVSWTMRFVDGFTVGSTEPDGTCANLGLPSGSPGCQFSIGAVTYHNLQAGVSIDRIKLRFGIDNLFDKQPPILYQNNSLNGNTDERTFDTVGRYYWTSLTVNF